MNILSQKKVGILGGVSWHSTQLYYQTLQKIYHQQKGKSHSLPTVINSLDLQEVLDGFKKRKFLIKDLQRELAIFHHSQCQPILIASHTMHALFTQYQRAYPHLKFIHIADAVGHACQQKKIKRVGLLGTQFTMQHAFYQKRLQELFDISVDVLDNQIEKVHHIITHELVHGKVLNDSRHYILHCIEQLMQQGCEAVILGCTELPMLFTHPFIVDDQISIIDPIPLHCHHALEIFQNS